MTRRRRLTGLWAELEREAHQLVLDILKSGKAIEDPENVASKVLFARSDISPSMRQEYLDALTETVRKQVELLHKKDSP
ncbi:MAG: hypothetical protein JWN44_619 [Myxococcales bacterium]|nr:hypothetical protein [Myxococcales bacterium]